MSASTPSFLLALQLDTTADERAIRRAYAVLLKQIDQESEPDRFQALRSAYESAQFWVRRCELQRKNENEVRQSELAFETPTPESSAAKEPGVDADIVLNIETESVERPNEVPTTAVENFQIDARKSGLLAFERFVHALEMSHSGGSKSRVQIVRELLDLAFASEDLINVDAQYTFEECLIERLGNGWRSCNGLLFYAAGQRFNWRHEACGLARFGIAGLRIHRAINESIAYERMAGNTHYRNDVLSELMNVLNSDVIQISEVLRLGPNLVQLKKRFPALVSMTLNPQAVAKYEEFIRTKPNEMQSVSYTQGTYERDSSLDRMRFIFGLIVMSCIAISLFLARHNSSYHGRSYDGNSPKYPEATRSTGQATSLVSAPSWLTPRSSQVVRLQDGRLYRQQCLIYSNGAGGAYRSGCQYIDLVTGKELPP